MDDWTRDAGILDFRFWILDWPFSIFDSRVAIFDSRVSSFDFQFPIPDFRFSFAEGLSPVFAANNLPQGAGVRRWARSRRRNRQNVVEARRPGCDKLS